MIDIASVHTLIFILILTCLFFKDVPEAPGTPEISNSQPTSLTLTWTPPESDGGAEITNYIIEKKDKFSSWWTKVNISQVKATHFDVTGLIEGTDYEFRVSAENKAGPGKPSNPTYLKVRHFKRKLRSDEQFVPIKLSVHQ